MWVIVPESPRRVVKGKPERMAATLWIVGILLLVDGIVLMLLRRSGKLGNLPWFVPQASMGFGAVCLIAAIITTG